MKRRNIIVDIIVDIIIALFKPYYKRLFL